MAQNSREALQELINYVLSKDASDERSQAEESATDEEVLSLDTLTEKLGLIINDKLDALMNRDIEIENAAELNELVKAVYNFKALISAE